MKLPRLFKRPPDRYIGGRANPYLRRWHLLPRNRFFNVYPHKSLRDDGRVLHDHPWGRLSVILKGGYWEHLPGGRKLMRCAGQLILRSPKHAHRVELTCFQKTSLS